MEREEDQPYFPRPSNAGPERCIRQMVYHAMNAPRDNQRGDRFILVLDDSSWHEELTAMWLGKTAFVLHSQQMPVDGDVLEWRDPTPRPCGICSEQATRKAGKPVTVMVQGNILHGHIDGIVTDLLQQDVHMEHKALSFFTVEMYLRSGVFPLDYIVQTIIYQKAIRMKLNPDIRKSCLLIKNKNSATYLDYVITYDMEEDRADIVEMTKSSGEIWNAVDKPIFTMEKIIANAIEKFRTVDEHVAKGTLPARPYEMGDWQCDYCPWGKQEGTCWAGYEKEMTDLIRDAEFHGEITEDLVTPALAKLAKDTVGSDVPKKYMSQQVVAVNSAVNMSIEEVCRRYLEVSNEAGLVKSEAEALKYIIKLYLKSQNASQGRAGEYTIHNQIQHWGALNREKIPDSVLRMATEDRIKEVLTIRKPKQK